MLAYMFSHEAHHRGQILMLAHQQATDAYLLGLARHKKGKLGTMDRTVTELLPDKSMEANLVVVI